MGQAKRTILVVEDEDDIRTLVGEALEMEGYAVIPAANGQEAIDALHAADLPDLILLDLMMPVKDGYEFRREQTAEPRWKDIPVVVMTADGNAIHKMRQDEGAAPGLRKPVDLDELVAVINRWCAPPLQRTPGER